VAHDELATSFGGVAAAYERGRPRYSPHVIDAIARAAGGGPRLLDVGAGTGRLAAPLVAAGFDVVAVEPLDAMRALLTEAIGPERALAGRAEALPLADGAVDGAVCGDAWHWFDGARAADELHRVVRPGGGVVVCVQRPQWIDSDSGPAWWTEAGMVLEPLWRAAEHPHVTEPRRPESLERHPGFDPVEVHAIGFVHAADRGSLLDNYASISFVASLPRQRRADVLAELEAILVRHGVDAVEVPYEAELWVTRRLPAQAPPAGPAAAAS
jgi:SAM-dependent methyltransferase